MNKKRNKILRNISEAGREKRRHKEGEKRAIYPVHKVLKQVHSDTGISIKATGIMNGFTNRLAHYTLQHTIYHLFLRHPAYWMFVR